MNMTHFPFSLQDSEYHPVPDRKEAAFLYLSQYYMQCKSFHRQILLHPDQDFEDQHSQKKMN